MAGLAAAHPWGAVLLLTAAGILCALAAVWFACSGRPEPTYAIEKQIRGLRWRSPGRETPGETERNLTLTRVWFWNSGRGILRRGGAGFGVRAPEGVEIWASRVAESNNPANRFELAAPCGGLLSLAFDYAGRGDGVSIEILHSPGDLMVTDGAVKAPLPPAFHPRRTEPKTVEAIPAPAWRRMFAAAIDAGLIVAAFGVSVLIHRLLVGDRADEEGALAAYLGLLAIFAITYGALFPILNLDTIGTRRAGLRLVALDGTPAGPSERWVRLAGKLAGVAALGLGLLWSIRHPGRLPWHDRVSGTIPVSAR